MTNDSDRFRENLKSYGVTFDEDVYNVSDEHKLRLPSHVEAVREQLLDFTHILPWKAVEDARVSCCRYLALYYTHTVKARGEVDQALLKCLPRKQTNDIYFTGKNDANPRSTLGHRPHLISQSDGARNIFEDHGIQEHEINFRSAMMIAETARRLDFRDAIKESRFTRMLNKFVFDKWLRCGDERFVSSQEATPND